MSAVVLLSPEELTRLIREAVRAELSNGISRFRSAESWISIKATGLPPTTIRGLIKSGVLRAAKVGRELRINSADLESYMQNASVKKAKPEPAEVIEAGDAFEAARARARAERKAS